MECGSGAGRARRTYLGAQYARLGRRRGKKKAPIAVGHIILETEAGIVWGHSWEMRKSLPLLAWLPTIFGVLTVHLDGLVKLPSELPLGD